MKIIQMVGIKVLSALLAVFTIASLAEAEIKITNPPADNFEVGMEMNVKGTANNIPAGNYVWVLVHRIKGFKTVWWPQGEAEVDPKTKTWEVGVHFGNEKDIGNDFDIAVITVNETEHHRLEDYRKKAMESGNWRPIPMSETTTAPVIRKVKKVSH